MKKITHNQAQSIIDIASATWKDTLFDKWGKQIVLKQEIHVSDDQYKIMRGVCTPEQHKLFDEIFGKDVHEFKVGDYFTVVEEYFGYNGKKGHTYKIIKISENSLYYEEFDSVDSTRVKVRPATPEEIMKATCLPEGTPCFVRDYERASWRSSWRLAYADGNGRFYPSSKKSGTPVEWACIHECSKGLPPE